MEKETIALNIMDIDRRIKILHNELEVLHEMKEQLIAKLGVITRPV